MADAIHEITAGQTTTLEQVAALYYAVGRPGGRLEPGRVARVIAAVRASTGKALNGVADTARIPTGTVLRIPTFRELPRAVLCDDPGLEAALAAAGYDHANKLLQRPLSSVLRVLGPFEGRPWTAADVTRAYALTSFLDLDGMDRRTAIHLYDAMSIKSLAELARQSEASLQTMLDGLAAPRGRRPAALATSGHAARWRASALIHSRRRFSDRLRRRPYQIPFASRLANARAEFYEAIDHDNERTAADRTLARRLGLLHRFQASVIDGNFHALARRWDRAGAAHMAARRLFHRLAEDVGAAERVDDTAGLRLEVAIDTVYRLLKAIPPGEESPLGAPLLRTTFDDSRRPYRLESDKTAQDGKSILLPAPVAGAPPVRVRLNAASFAADYKAGFLNPHLGASVENSVRLDGAVWADSGAFAAMAPYLYGGPVRATLGTSFATQGFTQLANQFSSPYFDLVAADGHVVRNWSEMDSYIRDLDLGTCSTDFVDPDGDGTGILLEEMRSVILPLASYCEIRLAAGDVLYRQNRRAEASAVYADVLCAIENYWQATGQSHYAADAKTAFSAVANAALTIARGGKAPEPFRVASQLTLLATAREDGSAVAEGLVTCVQAATDPLAFEEKVAAVRSWFAFEDPGLPTMQVTAHVNTNASVTGAGMHIGAVQAFVDARLIDAYYFEYLLAQARMQAIASGLNWFGFTDSFVPSWSFDYLYEVASDLAGKAVDAERHVFQMEQLFEQAAEKEFLAGQAIELAQEQLVVADARVAQAEAASVLASQQALLTVAQSDAAVNQSAFRAGVEFDNSEVQTALVEDPETGEVVPAEDLFSDPHDITNVYEPNPGGALINSVFSGIPYIGSFPATGASMMTARNDYVTNLAVLQQAVAVAQATEAANAAACATAAAERDVAQVVVNQAAEYLGFLENQTLNSEALEQLVALAAQVHGIYQYQAHRMAWLAQRAAAYESRRTFQFIGWEYENGDPLHDMMSAEFLRADLDALRAELAAGQTLRMQEVRWTLPLSRLDPAALQALRTTGRCVFVLRQDWVDREFPGTCLHRLKDVQMAFVGLLPPGGARGVLSMTGISWVRVPNTGEYATGETKADWTTEALAGSATPYDNYVMKRLDATPGDVSLSEFHVVGDRGVLSAPRGMLRPLENLGLDTAWTLNLPRRSNAFLFENIRDVELSFWFLCGYDPLLHKAQDDALHEMGVAGNLTAAARLSAVGAIPDQLAALRGPVASVGQVDNRYLTWRLFGLTRDEVNRRVTNLRAVCARRTGASDELTFRLLSQSAPAGVRLTTTEGAAVSYIGVSTSEDPDPPAENALLRRWLQDEFYARAGAAPTEEPQQTWVVKFCPDHVGDAWAARDEDGVIVTSDSGPLTAGRGAEAVYEPGAAWTSYAATLNVRKNGGEAVLLVRYSPDAGGSGYALSIGSGARNNVRLSKLTAGASTVLAQATLPYPDDEFLSVTLRVFGDTASTTLRADIDRLTVLEATDTSSPHAAGAVALRVPAAGATEVAFDDLQVVRLTRLGAVRESLLSESFQKGLPADWTFTDGAKPWAISKLRHKRLDLGKLLNVVLTVDYRFEYASVAPVSS